MITINNKLGLDVISVKKYEYAGEFMGDKKLTFSYDSPRPVNLSIGDSCIYRGGKFKLYESPNPTKVSSVDSYGAAFKYEVVMFHEIRDLQECDFLDHVPHGNNIHYSNWSRGSFFGDLRQLAERIQVNLQRLYSGWTILVDPSYTGAAINIPVTGINCWDALNMTNTLFGSSYSTSGKTITLGTQGGRIPNLFKYRQGLVSVEEHKQEQRVVTRLRAYGSTKNLPDGYNRGVGIFPPSFYAPNLMLPNASNSGVDYVDSINTRTYGVREAVIYFDGTDGNEDIYPSLEGMTAGQLTLAGISVNSTGALDTVVSASSVQDESAPTVDIYIKDIGFDINEFLGTGASVYMKSGACIGSELPIVVVTKVVDGVVPEDGDNRPITGYRLTVRRKDEGTFFIPNMGQNVLAGDKFALLGIRLPLAYSKSAEQRLLVAAKSKLKTIDHEIKSYTPKLDQKFIFENSVELMDGMVLDMADSDLNVSESLIIQSISIKEGEADIPLYELTISEKKPLGLLDKMANAEKSLAQMRQTLLDAFNDGIIDEQELRSIYADLLAMENERARLFLHYGVYLANQYLLDKSGIIAAWEAYSFAFDAVTNVIKDAIIDGVITSLERYNVDVALANYAQSIANYSEVELLADKLITEAIMGNIEYLNLHKNTTFFAKPDVYVVGDTWFLISDQIVNDILYRKGTMLHAAYATGMESDWRQVIYEPDATGGINILRNYDLRFPNLLYWGGVGETIDVPVSELPTEFYKTGFNIIADEWGFNYPIIDEDGNEIEL